MQVVGIAIRGAVLDEDVLRLDIPVHNWLLAAVKVRQSRRALVEDSHAFLVRKLATGMLSFEVSERHVFQVQEMQWLLLPEMKFDNIFLVIYII